MKDLLGNIRFYVLCVTIAIIVGSFLYVYTTVPSGTIRIIKLTQTYALFSITYLYFALLASPVTRFFRFLPSVFRGEYLKARRAIGFSAFMFAMLHANLAFFGQLGGFAGLPFLTPKYLIAISLSATALLILTLMASTSFDFMMEKLTFTRWKALHRFVYLASIFVLIHAFLLGTHFSKIFAPAPIILFVGLAFLLPMEAMRFDIFLSQKIKNYPSPFGPTFILTIVALVATLVYFLSQGGSLNSLGIHAKHLQALQGAQTSNSTIRYSASFDFERNPSPGRETKLSIEVFNAANGSPEDDFDMINEKKMHLIVVDEELNYFDHIHPVLEGSKFTVPIKFPKEGAYRVYVNFQPKGSLEQQFAERVVVGNEVEVTKKEDESLAKTFGDYKIQLSTPSKLSAKEMSQGKTTLTFKISNLSGEPITNLEPYLGAFGHLVMVRKETFEYIHAHPVKAVSFEEEKGGPEVAFSPLALFGDIKPGTYRLFAQFNPGGKLLVADFVVKIGE